MEDETETKRNLDCDPDSFDWPRAIEQCGLCGRDMQLGYKYLSCDNDDCALIGCDNRQGDLVQRALALWKRVKCGDSVVVDKVDGEFPSMIRDENLYRFDGDDFITAWGPLDEVARAWNNQKEIKRCKKS